MKFLFSVLVVLFALTSAQAATITPAFGKWSSAGGSVDAGKQNINTMQVVPGSGTTIQLTKPGGKPTMTIGLVPTVVYADTHQTIQGFKNFSGGIKAATITTPAVASVYPSGDTTGVTDTFAIQAQLDATPQRPVILADGTYYVSTINLHTYSQILGASMRNTKIVAVAGLDPALVTMDGGAVQNVKLRDLWIAGNNNGQLGLYFYARAPASGYDQGGLWYSEVRNVMITGFSGHSIWLRGGPTGGQHPNQFNRFENVVVFRGAASDANDARALLFTGQGAQHTFLNCELDGVSMGTGTNVEISREFSNGGVTGGASVGGSPNGDNAPTGGVNFITLTTQTAEKGVVVDRGTVNLLGGYFENLYRAVTFTTASNGSNVVGNRFANAASDGGGGGYGVSIGSGCNANIRDSHFAGGTDKFFVGASGSYGYAPSGTTYGAVSDGKTSGYTLQLSPVAGVLDLSMGRSFLVNANATAITTVNSYLTVGEDITLTAWGGDITLGTGGNLSLPGDAALTLHDKETVTITRKDLGVAWTVKGIAKGATESSTITANGTYGTNHSSTVIGDGGTASPSIIQYRWTGGAANYYQTTITSSTSNGGAIEFQTGAGGAALGSDTQTTRMSIMPSTGRVLVGTTTDDGTNLLQVNGSVRTTAVRLAASNSPLSGSACSPRTITWDDNYIYICNNAGSATKRAALTGGY